LSVGDPNWHVAAVMSVPSPSTTQRNALLPAPHPSNDPLHQELTAFYLGTKCFEAVSLHSHLTALSLGLVLDTLAPPLHSLATGSIGRNLQLLELTKCNLYLGSTAADLCFPRLRQLSLFNNGTQLSAVGIARLAKLRLPALRRLELRRNAIDAAAVGALAAAPWMTHVEDLGLAHSEGFGDDAISALAAAAWLTALTRLDVSSNGELGHREPQRWQPLASRPLPRLRAVNVSRTKLGGRAGGHLGAAVWLGDLRELRLEGVQGRTLEALEGSEAFRGLRERGAVVLDGEGDREGGGSDDDDRLRVKPLAFRFQADV